MTKTISETLGTIPAQASDAFYADVPNAEKIDLKAMRQIMKDSTGIYADASALADVLFDADVTFDFCEAAYNGIANKPADVSEAKYRDALALAATATLAWKKFPTDATRRKAAFGKPASTRDGATVSGTAIAQRANAWRDVVASGITPNRDDESTVKAVKEAFRLTSTGGSLKYREAVVAKVKAMDEEDRAAGFASETSTAMRNLLAANKKKAPTVVTTVTPTGSEKGFDKEAMTTDQAIWALGWIKANLANLGDDFAKVKAASDDLAVALKG